MVPNKVPSTRELPVIFPIVATIFLVLFLVAYVYETKIKSNTPEYVKWVTFQAALEKSEKNNKPILYDFTAEWCPPCKLMKKEVFSDRETADWINNSFIPVRVLDRSQEEANPDPEIEKLQRKYKIKAFPTLVVTYPASSEIEVQEGYGGAEKTVKFLHESMFKFLKEGSAFFINWKSLDKVIEDESTDKPLLLFFGDQKWGSSKFDFFQDEELISLVNKEFVPVAIEMPLSKNKFNNPKSKQLIERLKIKRIPTLVLLSRLKDSPHYLVGTSEPEDTIDFLEKFLQFNLPKK